MDINGCQIISEPADTPEGWTSTVTRDGVLKGPFSTIAEAVACARTWTGASGPAVQLDPSQITFNSEATANYAESN